MMITGTVINAPAERQRVLQPSEHTKTQYTRLRLVIAVGLVTLVSAALLANVSDRDFLVARSVYVTILIVAMTVIVHEWLKHGFSGMFTPATMVMLGYCYFFCYMPILNPAAVAGLYGDQSRVLMAAGVVAGSLVLFLVGYGCSFAWRTRRPATTPVLVGPRLTFWVCLFAALYLILIVFIAAIYGYSLQTAFLGSRYTGSNARLYQFDAPGSGYYLQQVYRWTPIIIASPAAYCVKWFRTSRPITIPILILLCVGTLGQGIRYVFAYTAGSIAMTFLLETQYSQRTPRARRVVSYGGYAILAAIFVLSAVQVQTRNRGGIPAMLTAGEDIGARSAVSGTLHEIGADQNYTLDGVIQSYNSGKLDLLWGESYVATFVMFIPKTWWPGKPGLKMADELASANPFQGANVSYSAPGELLFNFGWTGLIVGMITFGVLAGKLRQLFVRQCASPAARMMYATSLFAFAFIVRGSFATMFGGWMYPSIVTYLILRFCQRPQRPTRARS